CELIECMARGYESILKGMTPGNFNWFLHTMLFYHTGHVINKQTRKASNLTNNGDSDGDGDDDDM
ncbi:hypothetical protein L208DRAFT_1345720, partial [Tricholoma matsutake]